MDMHLPRVVQIGESDSLVLSSMLVTDFMQAVRLAVAHVWLWAEQECAWIIIKCAQQQRHLWRHHMECIQASSDASNQRTSQPYARQQQQARWNNSPAMGHWERIALDVLVGLPMQFVCF